MLWNCSDCTTAYSVGAPCCPHCGSTNHTEDSVPKITKSGGPSNGYEETPETDAPAPEAPKRKGRKPAQTVNATGGLKLTPPGASNG